MERDDQVLSCSIQTSMRYKLWHNCGMIPQYEATYGSSSSSYRDGMHTIQLYVPSNYVINVILELQCIFQNE